MDDRGREILSPRLDPLLGVPLAPAAREKPLMAFVTVGHMNLQERPLFFRNLTGVEEREQRSQFCVQLESQEDTSAWMFPNGLSLPILPASSPNETGLAVLAKLTS